MASSIEAFVYRGEKEGRFFAERFLASHDFTNDELKQMCTFMKLKKLPRSRLEKIELIVNRIESIPAYRTYVMRSAVTRSKTWVAFMGGLLYSLPNAQNPADLVTALGQETWYGPIAHPNDDQKIKWFVRPIFLPHWEQVQHEKPQKNVIRTLFFLRLGTKLTTIHWNGFTYKPDIEQERNTNFPYWNYIPGLFEEIEEKAAERFTEINLANIVLHTIWDDYRYNRDNYEWIDKRIRAQAGGVALSARSSGRHQTVKDGEVEVSVAGLNNLARTIRRAIQLRLDKQDISLPNVLDYDEVILQTLIRNLGTLSYEFELSDKMGTTMFHSHCYIGARSSSQFKVSQDSFPHLRVYKSELSDLEQLEFIIQHLRPNDFLDVPDDPENKSKQLPLC